ncbi:MAG: endonuclease III [Rickettsiaceae bacterium]|nr:MAG: endonuclease III [Rickettsiaceae bacterium]
MQAIAVNKIFAIFHSKDPLPRTELQYINNFTLLVSIVLSAQATDISVNKATSELFKLYNTPSSIMNLGIEGLKNYIKSIGLYNVKAKNIIALCKILIEKYASKVPDRFEQLITLPGVGRKTANVLLNCAYNQPTIAVDTHVYRVAKRIGLAHSNNPEGVEQELISIVPDKWALNAHHWLILHGRYICKARNPLCFTCPIKDYCQYFKRLQ